MDKPKNETVPKSERVSIATSDSPTTIDGRTVGNIILKNFFLFHKSKYHYISKFEM